MKILIIDNYDSFTFNLLHYMQEISSHVDVIRNDKICLEELEKFDAFILSPGPGLPQQAGICIEAIKTFYKTKKILGVCLGHQAIAEAFGCHLKNLDTVLHGVSRTTIVVEPRDILYKGLPDSFMCGRYHSWVVDGSGFSEVLEVTALDESNEIMSLRHKQYDVRGVQFHPESIMTELGKQILKNWIGVDGSKG